MPLTERWHSDDFARDWTDVIVSKNPARFEQFEIVRAVVADSRREPCSVLDLGCGSGLAASELAGCRPNIDWTGIDASAAMLKLAKSRAFASATANWLQGDITNDADIPTRAGGFDFCLAVQVLHFLDGADKLNVLRSLAGRLQPRGVLFVMDRFLLEREELFDVSLAAMSTLYARTDAAYVPPGSFEEYRDAPEEAGDRIQSVDAHLRMLGEAGYEAALIHAYADRGLIAARVRQS